MTLSDRFEDYMYTYIAHNGETHYYRTFLNPNGIWDEEGRVDFRVKVEEIPMEDWIIEQREKEISYDRELQEMFGII